jgi:hypothetical protein
MSLSKLSGTFYVRYYLGGLGGSVIKDYPSELKKSDYPNYGPIYRVIWKDGKRISKEWFSD